MEHIFIYVKRLWLLIIIGKINGQLDGDLYFSINPVEYTTYTTSTTKFSQKLRDLYLYNK